MQIGVVGLGLIGGSLARAAGEHGQFQFSAVDIRDQTHPLDVGFRHPFHPDRLPNTALRGGEVLSGR